MRFVEESYGLSGLPTELTYCLYRLAIPHPHFLPVTVLHLLQSLIAVAAIASELRRVM
jgi:hypothetical protein